jgi:hypothetical protein
MTPAGKEMEFSAPRFRLFLYQDKIPIVILAIYSTEPFLNPVLIDHSK